MRSLFIFLACLVYTGSQLYAQSFKEFSSEEAFLQELQEQIVGNSVGDAKKENKELIEKFTEMWTELGSFTAGQKSSFYTTSNKILDARMRPLPDVRNYIETVMTMVELGVEAGKFSDWERSVDLVLDSRSARKDFGDYMDFSLNLFSQNTLYSSGSLEWKSSNGDFDIKIEDGKPKYTFNNLDLTCDAKGSSSTLYETSGVLYPIDGDWFGKNGTITWERAGLDPNKVYAIVNDYEIKLKFSNYRADSVTFYNTDYFDQPLKGRLLEKVQAVASADRSSFPMFESYSQRLKIENIDRGIDYEGGFIQKGSRFLASGTDEAPAYLVFYIGDKKFLEVSSLGFSIKEEQITSADAAIKFHLHDDTITHPGLDFKYFRDERQVSLYKADEGLQKAPYFDSYHQMDIYAEYVTWKIDEKEILFRTLPNSSDNRAFFESDYYFRENRFDQMMGMSMTHPLVQVKGCFTKLGVETLYDIEIAKCIQSDKTNAMLLLLDYTNKGLVDYDPKTGKVRSTPRLYHYIAAKSELEDYDVLRVASDIGSIENARLDLTDEVYTLDINGIRNIILSDSHNVVLFPKNGHIVMKKNRDFDFSGVVLAGRLEFFGNNYEFLYDDFKIEMPNVDSVRINVSLGKEEGIGGRERLARVKNVIEEVDGTLEIDKPDNKSGLESLKQYPIFTSHEQSKVYYDRSSIQNAQYHRDNFYFTLDPFAFDSMDNFRNERIQFEGMFTSAYIFPEFREELTLQPDNSLGFVRNTPPDGFDVYRGKGIYKDTIKMSHEGLRGSGTLKYLTSTTKSDDFLFLPEEMNTVASKFYIEEQMGDVQYPPTKGQEIAQVWKPYDDQLLCESTDNPFVMYDGSTLDGNLTLTPENLKGGGLFAFDQAELESKEYRFNFSDFESDTANFRLKSEQSTFEGIHFSTNDLQARIDFRTRTGEFVSNGGTSLMKFPANQYVAFMDRFTWYMDQDDIELSGSETAKSMNGVDMEIEGSRFISIHPEQDSLEFYSSAARYSLKDYIIDARKVKFIKVADALIYPDSGLVTIERKAKMKTLTNASIIANAITKFHRIDSSTVNIFARRDYVGTGFYAFIDQSGNNQLIRFNSVSVDSSYQTYADGNISENRDFTLSPYFDFKGSVHLDASSKDLTFKGYSRINHSCDASLPISWFQFKSSLDPEEIYIPIDNVMLDEEENRLTSSIVLDKDTGAIYTAFLSPKPDEKHIEILPSKGFIFYHAESKEYRISNINKLTQQSLPGQYLALNTEECQSYGEGKLGFGINPGQLELSTVGNINHDIKTNKVELDVMMLIDFFFDDKLIDDMGKTMAEFALGDPIDFERDTYQRGLRELIGTDEADKLISAITLTGQFKKFPSELEKNLFLTDVQLKWNPESGSYQSVGKIGVGNVGKRQVNVKMNGKIEIVTGRIPEINIYLEADKDTWYYFKYSRNIMAAYSSIDDFNQTITDLKTDKRKLKVSKGQAPYSFMVGSKRRKDEFISRF